MELVKVQFRKLKGEIITVFPYEVQNSASVLSYMHTGQHSLCDWNINQFTKPAKPNEYKELLNELRAIGYDNLKVITKRSHKEYLKAYYSR